MTTPTPERPTMADDLDRAYARAHTFADGDREPAASVRANVLAAAREIAARAGAPPPLAPVAAPVSDVGRGRAGAWNLSSWRVRSGVALCALIVVALAAVRFEANRRGDGDVTLAAADAPPVQAAPAASPAPAPAVAPAPPKAVAMPAAVARQQVAVAAAPLGVVAAKRAKADDAVAAKAAPREPESVLAQADIAPAPNARPDASTVVAALEPPRLAFAPAPVERRANVLARPAPALRGSAEVANPVSAASVGSIARAPSTPLHAAAGADDVDALRRLLADPATRVDAADAAGRTPLLVAVMAGHAAAVRMLLAAGADPDHADSTGATPRGAARAGASVDVAALLADRP